MIAIAYYLLKVIVCSGILFLYYHVALRNKIFHQWNRFYLLAAVGLSLTLPLMQIAFYHYSEAPNQAIKLLRVVASADDYMETIYIRQHQSVTTTQWFGLAYLAVSVLLLSTLIVSVVKIYFIVKTHRIQFVNSIKFVSTQEQGTPFSFFRYIFWNDKIDIHSATGQQIFQHELVHVKEAHTFDKLLLQIILIFFWCNPFFWLIRKELQMIHEFIADKKAVQQHDTANLAAMILQASYPHQFSQITNPFFQSSIKRRLLMLTKIQNPRISYLSRILALPLIAFVVFAFSFKTKNASVIPLEEPITVVIDAGHGKQPNGVTTGARDGN
ncbi:MAG: M56 family metallopeptidase, partial [Flavisolibacter sp.]